jgi:transcriptional regulator with XRE-family HTH domain
MRAVARTPNQAQRLKLLLQHLGVNEAVFATSVGISASHLNRIATGERAKAAPSRVLVRGAQANWGVDPKWWVSDSDDVRAFIKHTPTSVRSTEIANAQLGRDAYVARARGVSDALAESLRSDPLRGDLRGEIAWTSDIGAAFARFAVERRFHPSVIEGLLVAAPPDSADLQWWLRLLFALLEKHPK